MFDQVDVEIIEVVENSAPVTLSELARTLGWSKSMVWRRVKRLSDLGLIKVNKQGGILLIYSSNKDHKVVRILRLGILRASEYPYVVRFRKMLRDIYDDVDVIVYDEAFRLALDLSSGRVHLALAPVPSLLLAHRVSMGRVKIIGGGSAGGTGIVIGNGGVGHATTMASTMELCAERRRLEPPRFYMRKGSEILRAIEERRVRQAVLWEPYLTLARDKGFDVEECDIPFCCVLGSHEMLDDSIARIKRLFAEAVSGTRTAGVDIDVYSNLISMPKDLVARTVGSYTFIEEPPVLEVKKLWGLISKVVMPKDLTLKKAFV